MRRSLTVVPFLTLALAAPALAAPAGAEMDAYVQRALAIHPSLTSAQATAEASQAREGVSRAQGLPQVSLSAGLSETTNVSNAQTTAQPFNLGTTGLAVRQNLFNFGKIDAAVAQAEAQTLAAQQQAANTAVEVAYGVRAAYLSWAQAAGLEAQTAEQVRFAEQTLAQAKARFGAGAAARLDVTRAETALAQARAAQVGARIATAQAKRSLAAAIGANEAIGGEPRFPAEPAVARQPLASLEQAALAHPNFKLVEAQVAQAEASQRAAERAGYPELSADASYGLRARDFQGAQNWQAGLNLSWPLFTGFSITSQIRAAEAQLTAQRAALDTRRLTLLRDVDNAHLAVQGARERLPAAQAALDSARANLTQAQGRYRAGVGSIIEVADAQSLLASAQADFVRATAGYHLAIADLQRAMGVTGVAQ